MNKTAHHEIFDAMAVGVATIDRQGRILFVNSAWQRFMRETVGTGETPTPRGAVGSNYVDAFTGCNGSLAGRKSTSCAAIEALLRGERDEYTLDYLSNAGNTQRWFNMTVRPLRSDADAGAVITLTEITRIKQAEEELRIAAIAFENQAGMVVLDSERRILRINEAFTRITGFSAQDALGQRSGMVRSPRHADAIYEDAWRQVVEQGVWHGVLWYQRKNGEDFRSNTSVTAVRNADGRLTHFVGNFFDVTDQDLREQEHHRREAEHRDVLVREVHHRIKNNLQGVIGILRDFGDAHPEAREPINQVVAKVQSIAVIHGLQGRAMPDQVRVCELTAAVAESVAALWCSPVEVDIPIEWQPCLVSKDEAVPLALVLNELVINAVKHSERGAIPVHVTLRKHETGTLRICIRNGGHWRPLPGVRHVGLELVDALLPRGGARLRRSETDGYVETLLDLSAPVISVE